ncbi:MAG: hypothetical protein JWP48_5255 [Actinoallomurus sp.]|jgi:hypothetical protein|nr:hypothetical protein [Actinoallomurus sp.]
MVCFRIWLASWSRLWSGRWDRSRCTPGFARPEDSARTRGGIERAHGRYVRRLVDAALGGMKTVLAVTVLPFKCVNSGVRG